MTAQEMARVLAVIRANLPSVFLNQTPEDARFMSVEWAQHFASEDPELVLAAARTYCYRTEDRKNFPTPGNIRTIYEELERMIAVVSAGMPNFGARVPEVVANMILQRGVAKFEQLYHETHPIFGLGGRVGEQKRLS